MAFASKQRKRLDIPHEPGAWIEVRPPNNGDLVTIDFATVSDENMSELLKLLTRLVVGWSYEDVPLNTENILDIDITTSMWLLGEIGEMVKGREAAEGKESATNSPDTLELVAVNGRENSGISSS